MERRSTSDFLPHIMPTPKEMSSLNFAEINRENDRKVCIHYMIKHIIDS
jgi:hypothetical protein